MRKLKTMTRDAIPASAPTVFETAQKIREELAAYSEEFNAAITKLQQAVADAETVKADDQ